MHPELFTIPVLGYTIKTYGFLLTIGFLSGVWLAMRRAERVKANPDVILDMSFVALMFGVAGARVFYVIHYWQTEFAQKSNKFLAAIDITAGGMEFLGGFVGAFLAIIAYALWKNRPGGKNPVSLRLYLDILAPSCIWGLAFGRLGCFFNGCCFGGLCVATPTALPDVAWGVQFPFSSPAHIRQWENREVTVPAELVLMSNASVETRLLPGSLLNASVEQRERPIRIHEALVKRLEEARAADPTADLTQLERQVKAAATNRELHERKLWSLNRAQRFPSRKVPSRRTSVSELAELADANRSLPVHPAQLYAVINALLLSGVLAYLFHLRKRHGVVLGALMVFYPISRVLLEMIRSDNPHDVGGLTASQSVSVAMFALGLAFLAVNYFWLPRRSPNLVPFTQPE